MSEPNELEKMHHEPDLYIFTPPILHAYHLKYNEFPSMLGKKLATVCTLCRWEETTSNG